jgi:hypothetical protein
MNKLFLAIAILISLSGLAQAESFPIYGVRTGGPYFLKQSNVVYNLHDRKLRDLQSRR